MIYFVSGHRDLTQEEFKEHYVPIIEEIIKKDMCCEFVVGDWEGCDTMFIEYILLKHHYPKITIYYVGTPRVSPFGVPITSFKRVHYYFCKDYDECDYSMTCNSNFDIAWIRPGKEDSHTAKNIKRRHIGKMTKTV